MLASALVFPTVEPLWAMVQADVNHQEGYCTSSSLLPLQAACNGMIMIARQPSSDSAACPAVVTVD